MRLTDWLHLDSPLSGHYYGQVVDNEDPEKLGRIRVESEVFQGIGKDDLPWCLPFLPGFPGSKNTGTFWVPEVGAEVMIFFPFRDPQLPVYYARLHTKASWVNDRFRENYPKRYGWEDEDGTYFLVDKQEGFLRIFHRSGVIIHINKDGDVKLLQPGTRKFYISNKDVHLTGNLYVDGHAVVQQWVSSPLYTSEGTGGYVPGEAYNINAVVAKLNEHISIYNSHNHIDSRGGSTSPPSPADSSKPSDGSSGGIHDPGPEPAD